MQQLSSMDLINNILRSDNEQNNTKEFRKLRKIAFDIIDRLKDLETQVNKRLEKLEKTACYPISYSKQTKRKNDQEKVSSSCDEGITEIGLRFPEPDVFYERGITRASQISSINKRLEKLEHITDPLPDPDLQ